MRFLQSRQFLLLLQPAQFLHCDQMVGVLNRELNKQYQLNLGQRPVRHQIRDQSERIQVSETNVFVENRFPKELLLESLQLGDVALQSGLIEHDRA